MENKMFLKKNNDVAGSEFRREVVGVIDYGKSLPDNIFCNGGYRFWFFERPILDWKELFIGLAEANGKIYGSDLVVCFGDLRSSDSSRYEVRLKSLLEDFEGLQKGFNSFFEGGVNYPVSIVSSNFEWFAFEGANEEYGVLGLRCHRERKEFINYLDSELIGCELLSKISAGDGLDSKTAKCFVESYCR